MGDGKKATRENKMSSVCVSVCLNAYTAVWSVCARVYICVCFYVIAYCVFSRWKHLKALSLQGGQWSVSSLPLLKNIFLLPWIIDMQLYLLSMGGYATYFLCEEKQMRIKLFSSLHLICFYSTKLEQERK